MRVSDKQRYDEAIFDNIFGCCQLRLKWQLFMQSNISELFSNRYWFSFAFLSLSIVTMHHWKWKVEALKFEWKFVLTQWTKKKFSSKRRSVCFSTQMKFIRESCDLQSIMLTSRHLLDPKRFVIPPPLAHSPSLAQSSMISWDRKMLMLTFVVFWSPVFFIFHFWV